MPGSGDLNRFFTFPFGGSFESCPGYRNVLPSLPITEHNLPGHCPLNALVSPQIIVTHTAPNISKVALGRAATLSGEFLVYALDLSPGTLSYSYPFHPTFTLTSSTCFPSILSHNEVKTKQRLSPPNTRSSSGEHTVSLLSQLTSTAAQSPTHWELSTPKELVLSG